MTRRNHKGVKVHGTGHGATPIAAGSIMPQGGSISEGQYYRELRAWRASLTKADKRRMTYRYLQKVAEKRRKGTPIPPVPVEIRAEVAQARRKMRAKKKGR